MILRWFRKQAKSRPVISISLVTLGASLWLLLLDNWSLWNALFRIVNGPGSALVLASLLVAFILLFNMALCLICQPGTTKLVLISLLIASSVAAYFMNQYGTMIDRGMMQNVFASNWPEIRELLSLKLLAYVLILGFLPVAFLLSIDIDYHSVWKGVLQKLAWISGSALLVTGIIVLFYQDYASIFRNHREIRFLLTPTNYLSGTYGVLKTKYAQPQELRVIGRDARLKMPQSSTGKKALTIIAVGETARAANFSLGGYARQTNPLMAREDIIYYSNATSCGTDTASSVPCMFSDLGQDGFSISKGAEQENLLDVLKRAGVAVLWRDNNSGCKGVCSRVAYQDLSKMNDPGLCRSDECFDEILLKNLQENLDKSDRDTVIILHLKGSHGPAYYLRYPDQFAVFKPVCNTNLLEKCSREEIVNAYDNTLLYTDFVLNKIIALLRRNAERFDASLIYMSDHGESLGENNIYLHGLPRILAPSEQTHIPVIVWLSKGALQRNNIDLKCLMAHRGDASSHDNLFHSVLGLMDVQTKIYRPGLDLFHACERSGKVATS
ncbi:MAG TPA: phosphoethanolamine--lipid A transferase [Burkholderiales bacterium]|nr:phosphoethanolamine--lipid A transferase [Burkholderiales bacterium]